MGPVLEVGMSNSGEYIVAGVEANAEGSVVAGLWTELDGARPLEEILAFAGVQDAFGWQLAEARHISADGRVIFGTGTNPQGLEDNWRIEFPAWGDATGDGLVNIADVEAVQLAIGQSGIGLVGDVNFDGMVDSRDVTIVESNLVPEPGSALLASSALFIAACLRLTHGFRWSPG